MSLREEDAAASQTAASETATPLTPSSLLLTVIAVATGVLVANLYYSQPLIGSIAPEIGISLNVAGAIVSVTQIGYAIGLFFLVSLADLVENKRLVMLTLGVTTAALVATATSSSAAVFFIASFIIGLGSTGAQVLVPFASHLVPEAQRGRTVGNIMSGLLTGILLARPLSLFVASLAGWRAVFWLSAGLMLAIGALLAWIMPTRRPAGAIGYGAILRSMIGLIRDLPILRRRAAYQALMFGAFTMFWTAVPLMLSQRFGLSQQGIALFALAGAGGAVAAPIAGRLGDRGYQRIGTGTAMVVLTVCFLATGWAASSGALIVLAILAVLLDGAVQVNQILSQRILFVLAPAMRGRLTAVYMTAAFISGAVGSIVATASYHAGGWTATAIAGGAVGVVALLLYATEFIRRD
ncbi:MAG: MFS transporter [Devosia sp.]|nr:MFS transporter [Devosia sp.]